MYLTIPWQHLNFLFTRLYNLQPLAIYLRAISPRGNFCISTSSARKWSANEKCYHECTTRGVPNVESLYPAGVAVADGQVILGGRLVRHATAKQLTDGARHTWRAGVVARQPAGLLIIRLTTTMLRTTSINYIKDRVIKKQNKNLNSL